MNKIYEVGHTLRTDAEYPNGVPCILVGGDSVLCEFPGSNGEENAKTIAGLLNSHDNCLRGTQRSEVTK